MKLSCLIGHAGVLCEMTSKQLAHSLPEHLGTVVKQADGLNTGKIKLGQLNMHKVTVPELN